nr:zinc-ribbon domain-containing protein [Candidatus Freyarchaeota archaeon]
MKNWSPAASIQNLVEELLQISEQVTSGVYNSQEKVGERTCILISFKICPYCGRRNSENANYCVYCGSNIAPPE